MMKSRCFFYLAGSPPCRTPLKRVVHQGNYSPCNKADITTTAYKRVKKRAGAAILALRPKQRPREGQPVMKLHPVFCQGYSSGPEYGTAQSVATAPKDSVFSSQKKTFPAEKHLTYSLLWQEVSTQVLESQMIPFSQQDVH